MSFPLYSSPQESPINLVILVHADTSMRARYEQAQAHLPTELIFVNAVGGLSSVYSNLGRQFKKGRGSILEGMARYGGARLSLESYDTVTVATYSAGYALAREMLADDASFEQLDGYVAIDSIHSGLDPDSTPRDSQLIGFVRQALIAADGPRVCWIGHTDVDPILYASTTDTAEEIERLTTERRNAERDEIELMGLCFVGADEHYLETGGFRITKLYDADAPTPKQEHGRALTMAGAPFLADAVETLIERVAELAPKAQIVTDSPVMPLGQRITMAAFRELALDVHEIPGPKHDPRIQEYLAITRRRGAALGLTADETFWCAAAASFCVMQARIASEVEWFTPRISVFELWSDAVGAGRARSAEQVRRAEYTPQPGDLWIASRGGPAFGSGRDAFKASGGKGHVDVVLGMATRTRFKVVGGNVNNTWTQNDRDANAAEFIGCIAMSSAPKAPDAAAVSALLELPIA